MSQTLSQPLAKLLERFGRGERTALARAISIVEGQRSGYAEFLNEALKSGPHARRVGITGPPGGGKGTVLATAMAFGGKLCHNIGHGYLFDDKVRTSEDCRPVLAGLAGKAIGYSDEYPDKVMNAETVKPLICARGGAVSARFGGARDTQATSIEVTATLFGVGNQALRLKPGVLGLAEKIYQLTPDFLFKNVGEVMGPGDVPHLSLIPI